MLVLVVIMKVYVQKGIMGQFTEQLFWALNVFYFFNFSISVHMHTPTSSHSYTPERNQDPSGLWNQPSSSGTRYKRKLWWPISVRTTWGPKLLPGSKDSFVAVDQRSGAGFREICWGQKPSRGWIAGLFSRGWLFNSRGEICAFLPWNMLTLHGRSTAA